MQKPFRDQPLPIQGGLKMLAKRNPALFYLQRAGFYLLVVVIAFYLLFPFLWAVLTSFRKSGDLGLSPFNFIFNAQTTFSNYVTVFTNDSFIRGLGYSLITAVGTVAVSIVIGSFAAYALGRFRFRFKAAVLYIILGAVSGDDARPGDHRAAGLHQLLERVPVCPDLHQYQPHRARGDRQLLWGHPVRPALGADHGGQHRGHRSTDRPGADLPAQHRVGPDGGRSQRVNGERLKSH